MTEQVNGALGVHPLSRTCRELAPSNEQQASSSMVLEREISVHDLAGIPFFVLLAEPGMGKSETMKALAEANGGSYLTADDAIVTGLPASSKPAPLLIDALDEARVSGDSSVWRELRKVIAKERPEQLGLACRIADWHAIDANQLAAAAGGRSVRVFELKPLTPDERAALLRSLHHEDPPGFEHQAQLMGLEDMLGNPQSLKMLAEAVKGNRGVFPNTRKEAYELACRELLQEPNAHHRQASRSLALHGDETLLDAAGWLCALLLLGDLSDVDAVAANGSPAQTLRLETVTDTLGGTHIPPAAVAASLKLRLFKKPRGHVPMHRTVAEFLAARHIARRIRVDGLQPQRVSALMVASGQYLITNLRGLAGWLAVLSEPMRQIIFNVDPWAVLDYGDLHLLSTSDKQALVTQLELVTTTHALNGRWQRSAMHVPLVQPDMFEFVSDWLQRFGEQNNTGAESNEVADVLLTTLALATASTVWTPVLLSLTRRSTLSEGVRIEALRALYRHTENLESLMQLLDEFHAQRSSFANKRLIDDLLIKLYPETVPPSRVMPYLDSSRREGNRIPINWFWDHHIQKLTPDDRLIEMMDAIEATLAQLPFKVLRRWKSYYQLDGLRALLVRAILRWGSTVPVENLTTWLTWCLDIEDGMLPMSEPSDRALIKRWLDEHPSLVALVAGCMVARGKSSWTVQHTLMLVGHPGAWGRFWLDQAIHWAATGDTEKGNDCLQTATWWVTDRDGAGITIDDLEVATRERPALQAALSPLLVSSLDSKNWRRDHWLEEKNHAQRAARRDAVSEGRLRQLLEHLEDVSSGKNLNYLGQAAMHEARQFGPEGKMLEDWRKRHPALDAATRKGYRALLLSLRSEKAQEVVSAHAKNEVLYIELPCLLAAEEWYREQATALFDVGAERLEALLTICLLNYGEPPAWFGAFAATRTDELLEAWLKLSNAAFAAEPIRIPQIGWLRHEASLKGIARKLLPELLARWPSKFSEASFPEFAQLLENCMSEVPAWSLVPVINRRLQVEALDALQTAYLVMGGVWIDQESFTTRMQQLLRQNLLLAKDLLGFVAHRTRHGDRGSDLPRWNPKTLEQLFMLLAPSCPSAPPSGAHWVGDKDLGREFLQKVLDHLQNDPSAAAQLALKTLLASSSTQQWHQALKAALTKQRVNQAESAFVVPSARQIALTLTNRAPANPADLMAVAVSALNELQTEIRNSPTNLINSFWNVDPGGKHPRPPHRPENTCRDVIAQWLSPRLSAMSITVLPELQHGEQKRSDIGLLTHNSGATEMLLPVEVKGDWHEKLWEAAYLQLGQQYAGDARCFQQGIYLVLWMGDPKQRSQHSSRKVETPEELERMLQADIDCQSSAFRIRVCVLDLSPKGLRR